MMFNLSLCNRRQWQVAPSECKSPEWIVVCVIVYLMTPTLSSPTCRLMAGDLGQRISTIFVDEFHDLYSPHPNRRGVWEDACRAITRLPKQRAFVSATHPPHLHEVFLNKAHIGSRFPIQVIRASTDRPELAYYVLNVDHSPRGKALWPSTVSLVGRLTELLESDERILIFFEQREQIDEFSRATGCAIYHSKLPAVGNTKTHNLDLWDSGKSQIMAATTAAGQGIDRPYVKFVVVHGHTFGMTPYVQQGGHGGRGGRLSYVILLREPRIPGRDPQRIHSPDSYTNLDSEGDSGDTSCAGPFLEYVANRATC
jgi:superfamily II DNA helicase RecQ